MPPAPQYPPTPAEGGVSVIFITRGRRELLKACLESLAAAGPVLEILAGIDGEDPASARLLGDYSRRCPLRPVQLPRSCRGEARGALAATARGRWLCFIDDDTELPPGYFRRLAALIAAHPGAAVFGGGQELHRAAGYFESAVYALLASPWGGGPFTSRFRPASGTAPAGPEKFILCNLTMDGAFLRERGLSFEGHLTSAEENLLLNRMAAAGAGMLLSGELNLVHRRRSEPAAFVRQVFGSGRGRGQITVLSPKGFSAFTLIPAGALCGAALAAFAAPALLGAAAGAYALACAASAALSPARAAVKPAVAALYPALHGAYALGWLAGVIEGLFEKLSGRPRPRRCRCETP